MSSEFAGDDQAGGFAHRGDPGFPLPPPPTRPCCSCALASMQQDARDVARASDAVVLPLRMRRPRCRCACGRAAVVRRSVAATSDGPARRCADRTPFSAPC